ncbi:spermatogenesis-associated protein 17 [Porites harrisoni]
MATFITLMESRRNVVDQLFQKQRDAEDQRQKEFQAALKIQSWFRGTKVRAYFKFLHHCATTIQRHFRGHKGREIHRHLVQEKLTNMRVDFYNKHATIIQKFWRGFYVRKYIYNYHSRKRYLQGIVAKNEIVRKELEEFAIKSEKEKDMKRELQEKFAKETRARKTHYLISTHQVPGVYNSPFYPPNPSAKEIELRNVRPLNHRSRQRLKAQLPSDAAEILNQSRNVRTLSRESKSIPLPPISMSTAQKMQGPFRTPDEVWQQRHKPLNPTLRVATSYFSAEDARSDMKADEWVSRLIDDKFLPFTHRDRPYEPLLHTTAQYGSLPYGTKHFREEDKERRITPSRFQTVVSPIPVFEQFGKTY